jgi:glyoxylase-like metal-dependent hydrolase (beta-lactamase superfamily II)
MQIAPHIHRFDTGPFNWYLIEQDSRLTLIDAGFPGHYSVLLEGLRSIGREPRDIEAILITHAHADHTGFAERLSRETGAPVFVHEEDRTSLTRILQLPWWGLLSNGWRPYISAMLAHAIWNGVFTMSRVPRPKTFRHGDELDVPGRPVVVHTPGHTAGEVSFYLPASRALFCGDTLATRNVLNGRIEFPQIMPPFLTEDFALARRSLSRLREFHDVVLLPGHGDAWHGNMNEAVDRTLHSRDLA